MRKAFIDKLAIFGPGLLGGSLAGAVRRHQLAGEICVWARRSAAAEAVVRRGWADVATTDVAAAVEDAQMVVLATPVGAMPELARTIVCSNPSSDCLVTDVGSVKRFVVENVAPIFDSAKITFTGSHPMAGGEAAGFDAARDDLFDDAACILTPHAASIPRLRVFWERLGCRVFIMSPAEHDAAIARISHLPHLTASALTLAALADGPEARSVIGRGFRDTTRVASADPALWTEILLKNRSSVEGPLRDLIQRLSAVLDFLGDADEKALRDVLTEAKRLRDQANDASPISHG
ncbi:MAG: prephenate dehydrogenase [Verrucomicrobiales bacterium]